MPVALPYTLLVSVDLDICWRRVSSGWGRSEMRRIYPRFTMVTSEAGREIGTAGQRANVFHAASPDEFLVQQLKSIYYFYLVACSGLRIKSSYPDKQAAAGQGRNPATKALSARIPFRRRSTTEITQMLCILLFNLLNFQTDG